MARSLVPFAGAVLCALFLGAAGAPAAWAHGGRFRGPGGRVPTDPTVPAPSAPTRAPPVTTPGSGIPSTTGSMPDTWWGTWWELNQWHFLPARGEALRKRRVVTGADGHPAPVDAARRESRALVASRVIRPYLESLLGARSPRQKDTVRAAALLALAKVAADDKVLERLLRVAEDETATPLERESAALAVGLLRRTEPSARVDAISLDLARTRLLALVGSGKVPIRARCFACFSLGLLADQDYGSPFSRQGRMVVKGLLDRLEAPQDGPDLPVALLTALAMQPRQSVPSAVHEVLRRAVASGHAHGRAWSPLERAHALTTYVRLRGPQWSRLVLRALADRRLPDPVQRAARLALGSSAASLDPAQRVEAAQALLRSEKAAPDHLTRGLGQIAVARLLGCDLRAGSTAVFEQTPAARLLLQRARRSFVTVRGFHALALALAARDLEDPPEAVRAFVAQARKTLLEGFDRPRGDADLRSAYVVGLGLLRVKAARDRLVAVLGERNAGPELRARAALALAQIGAVDDGVLAALRAVVADRRPLAPRSAAALALSLLTGTPQGATLVKQLRAATTQREQAQAAVALGRLADPASLPAVVDVARARKANPEMRALAIAVLGLLGDPEQVPSLFRLTTDANYIARTDALQEAFSLL